MAVCLFGNINVDIILPVATFPKLHQKIVAKEYYLEQGGSAANTCWWLAKLGVESKMVGCVGNDAYGELAIKDLKKANADVTAVSTSPKNTGIAVVISCGNDKRMIKVAGANEDRKFRKRDFINANRIHLSSNSHKNTNAAIEFASKKGIPLSWDPSEALFGDLLSEVDLLFINEDDYKRERETIEKNLPKNLVIAKNGGGCIINGKITVPSFDEKSFETTGAGDAFDAGFIYGLEKNMPLKMCGIWAVACASFNVRKIGSRASFTSKSEIEMMVKTKS
ncbi:MAG: carbohydrate kinase family protein [Candidatus Methanofastidiosia archaeon]